MYVSNCIFNVVIQKSFKRVQKLLTLKEKELRELSKSLFHYDYLDAEEIKRIIEGRKLEKEKVRNWDLKEQYLIKF